MSGVIALVASSNSGGSPSLPRSDREALAFARTASPAASAYCSPGDWLAAEYALAAGCATVTELETALASHWDQAWIGGGFLERLGDEFAALLAERRSATLLFEVLSCSTEPDGTHTIVRDAGRGARDEIVVSRPVVLVVSPLVRRTGYVSRYRRQQARKELAASTAGRATFSEPHVPWEPARPRTRRAARTSVEPALDDRMDAAFGITAAKDSTSPQAIAADPRFCAQHLVRYLAHQGLWERPSRASQDLAPPETPAAEKRQANPMAEGVREVPTGTLLAVSLERRPRQPHDSAARRLRQPRHR
jgi:hypothetical protein